MPVAQYPYPVTGAHPSYGGYNDFAVRAPAAPHDGGVHPECHSRMPLPHAQDGGSLVPPKERAPSAAEFSRYHMMGPPDGGHEATRAPVAGSHNAAAHMSHAHSGGHFAGSHAGVGIRPAHLSEQVAYASYMASPLDTQGGYAEPRRQGYNVPQQYSGYEHPHPGEPPGAGFERRLYPRPLSSLQEPQHHQAQPYDDFRAVPASGGFLRYLSREHLSPPASSATASCLSDAHGCPPAVTTKVEPDAEWWHEGDLLDRFQQVRLQGDDAPGRERTTPRRRRRNSEKRKEKSRDAARCRRGKESEIFTELANALPLPAQTVSQLDKASVMRLTIAYLKTRALCQAGFPKITEGGACASNGGGGKLDVEMDTLFLKALDGFLLVLSTDGDVVYTSENIVIFLGLSQVDVMGQSLYEYTHPCDHEEVRDLVSAKGPQEPRHAFLRLKCTLTAKGRSVNLKSASYKVVQVSGEVVQHEEDQAWLVALGTPVPHPSNIEFPLDKQTFVSKHSLDMKFTYVDDNVGEFCGYGPKELVGRSLYEMHHALDSELVKEAYKTLRSKGQVETGQYRFLARGGGYVWLVTQATLIHGPKDHKPQYVVCLNYVVSGVESPGEIVSELQLMCSKSSSSSSSTNSSKEPDSTCSRVDSRSPPVSLSPPTVAPSIPTPTLPLPKSPTQPKTQSQTPRVTPVGPPPTPVATTSKIFAPRTEEMNKGYLMFSEDDPQCTVLKEEPEDLTHLAPSGGDTCVPLPAFMPNLDDMFSFDYAQIPISSTDVLFTTASSVSEEQESNSGFEKKLISEEKRLSSRLSGGNVIINNSIGNSPASSCSSPPAGGLRTPEPPKPLLSQAALPSALEKKFNFGTLGCSSHPRTTTESFFSQLDESSNPGSEFTKVELKIEDHNMDSDEFDMRAPYIPHSDEMLVLSSDDLLWGAEVEPAVSPKNQLGYHRETKSYTLNSKEDSSLAQLLRDTDPPITSCRTGKDSKVDNGGGSQQSQYEQSKFFDGGENFVDPNKVLPGHCIGKDGLDGSPDCNDQGEDEPPAVMVQETVEPPPPLITIDTNQMSLAVKRGPSPNSSPILTHKKLCSLSHRQRQMLSSSATGDGHLALLQPQQQQQQTGVRLLTTPYAPTMQQLLISKEPITVRGRHSGGLGTHQSSSNDSRHSVLRNLLDVEEVGSIVRCEPQPGGSGVSSATTRPSQDRMTDMVATGGSETNTGNQLSAPKLRLVTGSQGTLMHAGHLAIKVASKGSGDGFFKRVRRQDPLLLMDPDLSIPDLLDLTQLDYEVNAPANNCSLLQGSDLLMALDQSP